MESFNLSNGADDIDEKTRRLIYGDDGEIYPWVADKFADFLYSIKPHSRNFCDKNGEINPWVRKKFVAFLSMLKDHADEKVNNPELEKEKTNKTSDITAIEKEDKAVTPSFPGKHKEGNQQHSHGDDFGNNGKSEMELEGNQQNSHGDDFGNNGNSEMELEAVHLVSSNSVMEMDAEQNELIDEDDSRKERLLDLLRFAAKKGSSIFKDTSFLESWSSFNRELLQYHNNRWNQARKDGKQVPSSENELEQNNGMQAGALHGEERGKNSAKVFGPPDTAFAVINRMTASRREDTHQGAADTAQGSTGDSSLLPQNMEKVAQLFHQILENSTALQHFFQDFQNGGNSSMQNINGQKLLEDNAREICHVNCLKKFTHSSGSPHLSLNELDCNKNMLTQQADKDSMEHLTPHKDKEKSSFADVLKSGQNNSSCHIPYTDERDIGTSSATHAFQQGKMLSIPHLSSDNSSLFKIEQNVLEKRLIYCKFSIVGRLTLGKGEQPWPQKSLKEKLQGIWGLKSDWKFVSLGRGYFHILLNSQADWDTVWTRGPLHLKPGVLRLQRWKLDFDPWAEKTSYAQIWIRIYNLPWGLWDPSVIVGIASKVGSPLRFDNVTVSGEFGHYARILVEVDVSKPIKQSVHIECGKFMFEVKLVPENLPAFCHGCSNIGHDTNDCRNLFKRKEVTAPSKNIGGDFIVSTTSASLEDPSTGNFASSSKNPKVHKKVHSSNQLHETEWRRKKDKGKEIVINERETVYGIVEPITDFSAQNGSITSYDNVSGYVAVSNQFEALEIENDLGDSSMVENMSNQQVDDKVIPTRWSDILEEEDKQDDPEPMHAHGDEKNQQTKAQCKDISQIRKDLQELSYAQMLHKTSSSKKKQKQKIGIKQSKDPIGSP